MAQKNSHGIHISMPIILYKYSSKVFRVSRRAECKASISPFLCSDQCVPCYLVPKSQEGGTVHRESQSLGAPVRSLHAQRPSALLKLLERGHEALQPQECYGSFYFSKLVTAALLIPCCFSRILPLSHQEIDALYPPIKPGKLWLSRAVASTAMMLCDFQDRSRKGSGLPLTPLWSLALKPATAL